MLFATANIDTSILRLTTTVDIADLVIWGGDANMIVILREPFLEFQDFQH